MSRKTRKNCKKRLAFYPSADAHEYFERLCQRLKEERGLGVRVTQREAFDHMVACARTSEFNPLHATGFGWKPKQYLGGERPQSAVEDKR